MFRNLGDPILHYAPEDGGGDDGDKDKGGGGESDLDKLRSEKDGEIARLQASLTENADKLRDLQALINRGKAVSGDLSNVQAKLEKLPDDPDKALEELKEMALDLAADLAETRVAKTDIDSRYKEARAEAYANAIAAESGGSAATYKAELLKAKNESEMKSSYESLAEKTRKEKDSAKGNGNERQRQVDGGSGRAVDQDLLREMQDIDVTTPEGREEWEKKQAAFRRKIEATAR